MLDTKTRLVQARDAIHSLELQIEQYAIHINELGADAGRGGTSTRRAHEADGGSRNAAEVL